MVSPRRESGMPGAGGARSRATCLYTLGPGRSPEELSRFPERCGSRLAQFDEELALPRVELRLYIAAPRDL